MILSIFAFSFLFSATALADPIVTFSEDTTLNITVAGSSTNFTISAGSTANEVIVNVSSIEITKGSAGNITLLSPNKLYLANDQSLSTNCDTNNSKLIITVASKIIITPISQDNYCAAILAGSGGGGGGGGSGTGLSSTGVVADATTGGTSGSSTSVVEEGPLFKDISDLSKSDQSKILQIAQLMLDQKTYKVPSTKKYRPASLTRGDFDIQIWNAVAGIGCGSDEKYPGITACKKQAVEAKLISDSFPTDKRVTRLMNYMVLLKAKKIKLEKDFSGDDLEEACSDVKKGSSGVAQIYFTARKYKIASKYKGNSCRLNFGFSRKEAARFAVRAIGAE